MTMLDKDWKHPMALGEIIEAEEGEVIGIEGIKMRCLEFAIEMTRHGIYKPDEILKEAIEIFRWVTDYEVDKKQS